MEEYFTVSGVSGGEYSEKRSRFIAACIHCETEQDAQRYISEARTKYFDARHIVYVYSLADNTVRFSDDGEPHGTAAKPILDLIKGAKITNVLITVVRYFGGTLLGTGGLVRAYSAAAKGAVETAQKVKMCMCDVYSLECDYTLHNRLVSLLESLDLTPQNTDFADKVSITVAVPKELSDKFLSTLAETFSSKIVPKFEEEKFYPKKV